MTEGRTIVRLGSRHPAVAIGVAVILIVIALAEDWLGGPLFFFAPVVTHAVTAAILVVCLLVLVYAWRLSLPIKQTASTHEQLIPSPSNATPSPLSLLQTVLAELVAAPESKLAYRRLLSEVESVTGGSASAIFISRDGGRFERLAWTSADFVEFGERLLLDGHADDQKIGAEPLQFVRMRDDASSYIAIASLDTRIEGGRGCLLLKIPAQHLVNTSNTAIETLGEGLGAILGAIICSAQRAQTDRKLALYRERAVIARELHDSLAQSLSYLRIQVSRLQSVLELNRPDVDIDRARADSMLQEIRTQLNLAHRQLREIITTFRLTMNGGSFQQALQASISEFEGRSGIAFSVDNRLSVGTLSVDEEMHVLQIVREAFTNVVRHSHGHASHVSLREYGSGIVDITIDDDGIGVEAVGLREQHHGLVIMQQRAHELGGELRVTKSPRGGARIHVRFGANSRSEQERLKEVG